MKKYAAVAAPLALFITILFITMMWFWFPTTTSQTETKENAEEVISYGEGVYYFPYIRADFASALVKFLQSHTNLEVTAMTGDVVRRGGSATKNLKEYYDKEDYGAAVGYFVTFREKK